MKKILICVTAAALVFLLAGCGRQAEAPAGETKTQEIREAAEAPAAITAEPAAEEAAEAPAQEAQAAPEADGTGEDQTETAEKEQPFLVQVADDDPAVAYVLVRMRDMAGLLPLPTEGEYTRTIRQVMDDHTEAVNVLHLTPEGFWMEDANCEGHDCINEGEVTLENREERVLWNMVICLPHELSAELITREEAIQLTRK